MADNLNGIINDHDYRLRRLETTPTSSNVLNRIIPAGGSDGDVLTKTSDTDYEMAWETPRSGYILSETVVYSSSTTFAKEYYTGIKAVRVKVQGAGGGGGGADDTTAPTYTNYTAIAGGGGGGAYSEKFITADYLSDLETVTVGTGGSGGGTTGTDGTDGGQSSFGSHVVCNGGTGGTGQTPVASISGAVSGAGGTLATAGDVSIEGGTGNRGVSIPTATPNYYSYAITSTGGNSFMGHGAPSNLTADGTVGVSGVGYGAGGSGGTNTEDQSTGKSGGAGTDGIVIVEIYI